MFMTKSLQHYPRAAHRIDNYLVDAYKVAIRATKKELKSMNVFRLELCLEELCSRQAQEPEKAIGIRKKSTHFRKANELSEIKSLASITFCRNCLQHGLKEGIGSLGAEKYVKISEKL